MNNWISVKDRLPDNNRSVLAIQKTGYKNNRVTIVARYVRRYELESRDWIGDWSEYCEEKDGYFCPEGWYETQWNWDEYEAIACNDEVTHWMELPEKPRYGGV